MMKWQNSTILAHKSTNGGKKYKFYNWLKCGILVESELDSCHDFNVSLPDRINVASEPTDGLQELRTNTPKCLCYCVCTRTYIFSEKARGFHEFSKGSVNHL